MSTDLTVANDRTLYALCDDLQVWTETLQGVEDALSTPLPEEEREDLQRNKIALSEQIERIGAELVTKTDSVAGVLRRIATEQDLVKAEEQRLHARRKAFERADKWLRGYVLSVMQQRQIKQLKTPSNTLFIRQSEGAVVTDESALPAEYQNAEIKVPLWLWNAVSASAAVAAPELKEALASVRVKTEPSLSAVKRAIKSGAEVPGADLEFRDNLVLR